MKKKNFALILAASLMSLGACSGNNNNDGGGEDTPPGPIVISDPTFSQEEYSYDKNASGDLEMPLDLHGVNVYVVTFDDYQLSSKQYSYNRTTSCLVIKESFIENQTKGIHIVKVIFDDEVNPAFANVEIMNSIQTSFDTKAKQYKFGKTGDLHYECDFSTATVKKLLKGDVEIPSDYYSYADGIFTLSSELLDRCPGTSGFKLLLSNKDTYEFDVSTDIAFFTDYDITTIHSEIESVYGANPLYQYASSESVSIVDGEEFGMSGRVLKYIPNYEDVELDCHGIMTLANNETGMTWYKVGYKRNSKYLISFDYQTIGSSSVGGQTFQFASVSNWGAPFVYSNNLLLGPENDNKVHHFSVVLTGEQISSGTIIYAKWLGGSGYLLLDNMRVYEMSEGFSYSPLTSVPEHSGNYVVNLNSNGWQYDILIDDTLVEGAIKENNKATIPSSFMDTLSAGKHKFVFHTSIADFETELIITSSGSASFSETTKSFSDPSLGLKFAGSFESVALIGAKKYGKSQYDVGHTEGTSLDLDGFEVVSDGLIIKEKILQYLYGRTPLKVEFSNGDSFNLIAINEKVLFLTDFNNADVWCYGYNNANVPLCQDTSMTRVVEEDGVKHLEYEPKNATLPHSSTPGTHQNGVLSFKSNVSATASTYWEPLSFDLSKTYRFTLKYEVLGANENVDLRFYRWKIDGSDDRTTSIPANQTTYSYDWAANDIAGFYFFVNYSSKDDVANYKVKIYSFKVEAL